MLLPCPCDDAAQALAQTLGVAVSPARHFRRTSLSHMSELPTDLGTYVVKAVPDFFAHEGPVVEQLSHTSPGLVPHPVALGDGWWVSARFRTDATPDVHDVLGALERIQRGAATVPDRLEALGVRTVTGAQLLAAFDAELVTRGTAAEAARRHRAVLARSVSRFDDPEAPRALVHGDLNPENVVAAELGALIYDWTDASLTHPAVDLLRLRELPGYAAAAGAYLAAWDVGRDEPARALAEADVWGAAFQLWNYVTLTDRVRSRGGDLMNLETLREQWWSDLVAALSLLD